MINHEKHYKMKKIILLLLLFISIKSNSQCKISFDDIYKSASLSFSQFETFALNNGYSYNSQSHDYMCDIEYMKDAHPLLDRSENKNKLVIISHFFFQKSTYLSYKSFLETNGKYINANNDNNSLTQAYDYNGDYIVLKTTTYGNTNSYSIILGKQNRP